MVAFAGSPLVVQGRVLGVMAMFARHQLSEFVPKALASVASAVAIGIERKRGEEALRQSEERLRQTQKMEAVGRLAGGIAHDFNNLLTAILGSVDFLRRALGPEHPEHAETEEIQKAAVRAADLTRQLLAFSRQQVLAPKVLELDALVTNLEKMLRRLIGEDVELRFAPKAARAAVRADPGQP